MMVVPTITRVSYGVIGMCLKVVVLPRQMLLQTASGLGTGVQVKPSRIRMLRPTMRIRTLALLD